MSAGILHSGLLFGSYLFSPKEWQQLICSLNNRTSKLHTVGAWANTFFNASQQFCWARAAQNRAQPFWWALCPRSQTAGPRADQLLDYCKQAARSAAAGEFTYDPAAPWAPSGSTARPWLFTFMLQGQQAGWSCSLSAPAAGSACCNPAEL